jgi:uncharacterized protein YjcR
LESDDQCRETAPAILKVKNKGGAPRGNRNALKHGRYTAARRARDKHARIMRRYARALNKDVRAFGAKIHTELSLLKASAVAVRL